MKTKLDRVPEGLHTLIGEESQRRGAPRTYVYKEIEDSMRIVGSVREIIPMVNVKREHEKQQKPLFRF